MASSQQPSKIASGLPNATDLLGDRFSTTSTTDGKFWFISRKGLDQPSISYFHATPLQGANLIYFDLKTKSWSRAFSIPSISDEELLEGQIFGYKNHLLLLTYQRSKIFQFRDLYEWRENRFEKIDRFEIDEKTKFECGDHAEMKIVADEANVRIIAQNSGSGVLICRFEFDEKSMAKITIEQNIPQAFPQNACGAHIVRATIKDHDQLYFLYGQQGCGFRWCPTNPVRIDLKNGKIDYLKFGDEMEKKCPPWSFSGAYADYLSDRSRWFFFGGCRAKGLSSTEDDRSIWELNLDEKEWKRFDKFDLPEGAVFVGAFDGKFYTINLGKGVYEIDPK